jgi:iron complex transport system permease protein
VSGPVGIRHSDVLPADARVVTTRSGGHSVRVSCRTTLVVGVLVALGVVAGGLALAFGDYHIALRDVLGALLGDRDGLADSIVVNWRLPRVTSGLLFGAALGVSGALFQSLAANPLASPDVIGFDSGAMTGALVVLLILPAGSVSLAAGAIGGGLATALIVYVLAYRGGVHGFRLVLVGIAVAAMLSAVNQYLVLDAIRDQDLRLNSVRYWMVGSLNGIGWGSLGPTAPIIVVLLPIAVFLGRPMRSIEMGDDAATALGVRLNPVRLAAVLVGVGLTAAVTSACGPISFVALAAPQIAKRLARAGGVSILPAAAMGALLLGVSDLVALNLFPGREFPVGAITVSIGGCYFVWLLFQERKRS